MDQKYVYEVEEWHTSTDLQKQLAKRTARGWRLHSVVVILTGKPYQLIFERPVA